MFKPKLVEHFRLRAEQRKARERYMSETYAKLLSTWTKKVDRAENNKRRKEKEAKARELYEKIFPELRKQREDKERDHRLGTRGGAVRSEADIEDVIERLQEREMEDKKMHSYAVIPPLLLPEDERKRKFTNNNGLILDSMHEYNERKFVKVWTDQEKEIFKEKFLQHPKNFGQIAQFLERKTVSDCVQYYYLSKKTENYKQLLRRVKVRRGKRTQPNQAAAVAAAEAASAMASGVMTRNRRGDMDKDDKDGLSNRSTPQPKAEIKQEADDDDKKGRGGNKNGGNDSSDEEKPNVNALPGKNFCPIPTCTTTKPKVKARVRHLPKKWSTLSKEAKDLISSELRKWFYAGEETFLFSLSLSPGCLHFLKSLSGFNGKLFSLAEIPNGTKKVCSGCFTRIVRKINQHGGGGGGGGNSSPVQTDGQSKATRNGPDSTAASAGASGGSSAAEDGVWSDEHTDLVKVLLKAHGRNWNLVAEKMGGGRTAEQCKKFFYTNRKKLNLDKIVLEYKRVSLVAFILRFIEN